MSSSDKQEELDQIRRRFLEAETELRDAVIALQTLQKSAVQLAEAKGSVAAAAEQLSAMQGGLAAATDRLARGAADLRTAIDAISSADPARLRTELEAQHRALVQTIAEAQRGQLDELREVGSSVQRVSSESASGQRVTQGSLDSLQREHREFTGALDRATEEAERRGRAVAGAFETLKADLTRLETRHAAHESAASAWRKAHAEASARNQREMRILFAFVGIISAVSAVLLILARWRV